MEATSQKNSNFNALNQNGSADLLLISSRKMLSQCIATQLSNRDAFNVRIENSLSSALSMLDGEHVSPDLILFEPDTQYGKELGGLKQIVQKAPKTKIVSLNDAAESFYVRRAFQLGISGVVTKDMSVNALEHALGIIHGGETFIPSPKHPKPNETLARNENPRDLTSTESECLRLSAEGFSNKEIGSELDMTEGRVKVLGRSVCSKLKAKNRTHAVAKAIHLDLI